MKYLLALIFLLLSICQVQLKGQAALLVLIFGEKAATENFYFSLKAGATYSMITDIDNGNNRIGANFGLVNNIKLSDKFYLTPEFLALAPRGMRNVDYEADLGSIAGTLLDASDLTDRKLSYIDIPILLRYHASERLRISAGPQVSFLTRAEDTFVYDPGNGTTVITLVDIKDQLKSFDFSLVLDLSYMISKPTNGKGVVLFARWNHGMIRMTKTEEYGNPKNLAFQLGASFPFIQAQDQGE